ncbi:hypothetical protein M758_12G099000 [Ceratodon purpureus]|nr:hypothetical protein M758_12G099000 [Ceratodon purpureus]
MNYGRVKGWTVWAGLFWFCPTSAVETKSSEGRSQQWLDPILSSGNKVCLAILSTSDFVHGYIYWCWIILPSWLCVQFKGKFSRYWLTRKVPLS